MIAAAAPVLVLAASLALLTGFFLQPMAALLFLPWVIVIAGVGWISPAWGLCLFLISNLVTLQLPILAGTPHFAASEPAFFALAAVTALRQLRGFRTGRIAPRLWTPLVLYGALTVLSAIAVWITFTDLPSPWIWTLTGDALSRIYFWRWLNPFHFLRMTLLILEGLAAFWIALHAYRSEPERTVRLVAWGFAACTALLAGYSVLELLFRGKEISVFPGFGPVFNDRNAYAAFWVLAVPICLALAVTGRGPMRLALAGIGSLGLVLCGLSLSVTGLAGMLAALTCWLWLEFGRRGYVPWKPLRSRWGLGVLSAGLGIAVLTGATLAALNWNDLQLEQRFGERASFWIPALAMTMDSPALGVGPGQFSRLLPEWRDRLEVQSRSAFEHENVHNYYLQLAAENGIPAASCFVLAVSAVLIPAFRQAAVRKTLFNGNRHTLSIVLPGLVGLLVVSAAQHPLLLFSFQTWFWMMAAIAAGATALPAAPKRIYGAQPGRIVAAVLAGVGLTHFLLFPPPPRVEFLYGVHAAGPEFGPTARLTEAVAFVRTARISSGDRLTLRSLHPSQSQLVRIDLNADLRHYELQPGEEVTLEWVQSGGIGQLGLRVDPPVLLVFADSIGGGIVIEGIPPELAVEPGPRK